MLMFSELSEKQVAKGSRIATGLLSGVGRDARVRFRTAFSGSAIHVQRALTAGECDRLPDWWRAIPAVDELGPIVEF